MVLRNIGILPTSLRGITTRKSKDIVQGYDSSLLVPSNSRVCFASYRSTNTECCLCCYKLIYLHGCHVGDGEFDETDSTLDVI